MERGDGRLLAETDLPASRVECGMLVRNLSFAVQPSQCTHNWYQNRRGSGNPTFSGWGEHLEVIEHLHPSFAADAFDDTAVFIEALASSDDVATSTGDASNKIAEDLRKAANRGIRDGRLVVHKIDRSARNFRDWALIGDLADSGIEIHFATETLDFGSRGGRLAADVQAVVAADYIRNLRDETKKGLQGRLKQGIYPFKAPLGYLDTGGGNPKAPATVPVGCHSKATFRTLPDLLDPKNKLAELKAGAPTIQDLVTQMSDIMDFHRGSLPKMRPKKKKKS